jgi:peptidoglycan/LPS O-acetylase OafA/YrhL
MNQNQYRPDIDGLRAIAVLSVLLHHLNASLLPGGFVGVDIFFVISGYLITSHIYKEISDGTFSLKQFYIGESLFLRKLLWASLPNKRQKLRDR